MHQAGEIDELEVIDVAEHPKIAEEYNVRSVPHYLINQVAFSGLKTRREISDLLQQDEEKTWLSRIREDLSGGQLAAAEKEVRDHAAARQALLELLQDEQTELVVRIGLTAIIESLAPGGMLLPYETQFIDLCAHADERIALDALYYLQLIGSPACLQALERIALSGRPTLAAEAEELLAEKLSEAAVT